MPELSPESTPDLGCHVAAGAADPMNQGHQDHPEVGSDRWLGSLLRVSDLVGAGWGLAVHF